MMALDPKRQPVVYRRPEYDERRGDHVWTEGDRTSPIKALRLDYWSYEPVGHRPTPPPK